MVRVRIAVEGKSDAEISPWNRRNNEGGGKEEAVCVFATTRLGKGHCPKQGLILLVFGKPGERLSSVSQFDKFVSTSPFFLFLARHHH